MKKFILPFLLMMSFGLQAQERIGLDGSVIYDEPQSSVYSLVSKGEKVRLGDSITIDSFWNEAPAEHSVCYDRDAFSDAKIISKFDKLVEDRIIDDRGCWVDGKVETSNAQSGDLFDIMMASIESKKMKIVAVENKTTKIMEVVLTNSERSDFSKKNALTTRDKFDIAGITIASTVLGTLVERRMFPGQKDKLLHRNVGAMINIGGNLASYLVFEKAGLGDRLGLTRKQKKVAILLTGSILGAVAGWGKERFYDYYHKDIHTYDPYFRGDAGATWLGGGAMTPLLLTIATAF
ncbi:MAG: hypothetical protein K2Q18_10700 [Bdellovibrionales bacterium]|nr:hypothetical protein [Bdellovibrionales bacterium]